MKSRFLKISVLLLVILFVFSSCASMTPIPPNATEQQISDINAMNIAATAKNTSTLAGIQIASIVSGLLLGLFAY